jgi:enoyl-CoA hydratase
MSYGKVSALDADFCEAMAGELDRLASDNVRAVVLTGSGSTFSAGVDLYQLLNGGSDYVRHFLPVMDNFLRTLLVFPRPLVAAVNGHAIAGGCIIAAAADYRLMSEGNARIGVPEVAVGVPFPRLPFEIIAARLSPRVLREVVYSGRTVHAEEAEKLGFIDEAVEEDHLLGSAIAVAHELAAIPERTFALTKHAFTDRVLERVRGSLESNIDVVEAWVSADVHAAIRRYLDKTIKK